MNASCNSITQPSSWICPNGYLGLACWHIGDPALQGAELALFPFASHLALAELVKAKRNVMTNVRISLIRVFILLLINMVDTE